MDKIIYKLADGRMWNVSMAQWIDPATPLSADEQSGNGGDIINLISADGKSDIEYLAKTLAYYDYPLGELVIYSEKGIKEALARLDEELLTPRTLAGLTVNEPEAIARYQEHEARANPLRQRLAELSSQPENQPESQPESQPENQPESQPENQPENQPES